jgi:hypothetical protein
MTNKISKYHILSKSWCYYQSNLYDNHFSAVYLDLK